MFHPLEEGACDELRASAGEGLRGVCLFPAMHHLHADQDEVLEFISVAAELRLIVFVHFGLLRLGLRDKLGLPSPFDLRYSNPIELCRAAQQFPQVPFVIPHLGAGFFREVLLLASQCPNVHLDTSSSNSWVRTQPGRPSLGDVLHQALEVVGSLRLLFGSDSNVFPAASDATFSTARSRSSVTAASHARRRFGSSVATSCASSRPRRDARTAERL